TFFVKDEFLSSLFTKDTVRLKMEEEIAHKAKVAVEDVSIDLPSLPSVPYQIVDVLMAYMNIIRVYTLEQHREQVQRAASSVLGESALSSLVSY
ncbi:MAG: hypothetical protein ABSA81_09995, partial [Candidatus Bathyarchaeia archaeon]